MSVKADCAQLPPVNSGYAEQNVYTDAHTPTLTKIQQLLCPVHQVFVNSSVLTQAVLLWNHKQPEKGFYMKIVGILYSDALCNTHLAQHMHITNSHKHKLSMQETCYCGYSENSLKTTRCVQLDLNLCSYNSGASRAGKVPWELWEHSGS